jgi:hypothetical protein
MGEERIVTVRGKEYYQTLITTSPTMFDVHRQAFTVFKRNSRRVFGLAVAYRVTALEIPRPEFDPAADAARAANFDEHYDPPSRRSIIRVGVSFINENKDSYSPTLLREQTERRMEDEPFRAVLYDRDDTPCKAAVRALHRMSWEKMHKNHVPLLSGIGHLIRRYGQPGVCVGWLELGAGRKA